MHLRKFQFNFLTSPGLRKLTVIIFYLNPVVSFSNDGVDWLKQRDEAPNASSCCDGGPADAR